MSVFFHMCLKKQTHYTHVRTTLRLACTTAVKILHTRAKHVKQNGQVDHSRVGFFLDC